MFRSPRLLSDRLFIEAYALCARKSPPKVLEELEQKLGSYGGVAQQRTVQIMFNLNFYSRMDEKRNELAVSGTLWNFEK